jgi:hypothetical protein
VGNVVSSSALVHRPPSSPQRASSESPLQSRGAGGQRGRRRERVGNEWSELTEGAWATG